MIVKYRFNGQKKVYTQNVKTEAEAKHLKRFIGKEGKVEIIRLRKKPKNRNMGGFNFPNIRF